MKSLQFRSIAPKAPAVVPSPSPIPSPAVLSRQPPSSLPEASAAAKSIIVPAQNYALMQIAGQDGTFSLVALPPSVSAAASTPHQQKNLKLPIPRYQPVRSKGTTEKTKATSPAARLRTASAVTQTKSGTAAVKKHQEPKHTKEAVVPKEEPSEQLIFIDPAATDISVTALLPDNAVLYPGPDGTKRHGLIQNLRYHAAAATVKCPPGQTAEESKPVVRLCPSKPQSGGIAVLSPAIFSKAVQIIPSPPRGKLPILPYSKMKSALLPAAKLSAVSPEKKITESHENADALSPNQVPKSQAKTTLSPVLVTIQKPPGKKRGRKRKTMEDIIAFEARKKRSLSFFRRRAPEKPPAIVPGSKQKEVDISKKYRSIRPKPVLLMETVPQLVSLPAVTTDGQEQELILGHQLPCSAEAGERPAHSKVFVGSRPLHRCPTCGRCFQFKHHLQSHVISHGNSRPHVCPVCRKAYAHSGSLSTHSKLHHAEARPRSALHCEFCDKAFGYVGVYFAHLREVHKVVLTVEPSVRQHEDRGSVDGADSPEAAEEPDREDPVELQIKCGRCQAVTPTFADMKMHLLHVHGEEVHLRPRDGAAAGRGGREAEDELVKHAAHYWRQLNERRSPARCGGCDEEFLSLSKLKRHVARQHRGSGGVLTAAAGGAFNCVLCSIVLDSRRLVEEHWTAQHRVRQPGLLWNALSCYCGPDQGGGDGGGDAPSTR